jgi:signal transduction histidine kinase
VVATTAAGWSLLVLLAISFARDPSIPNPASFAVLSVLVLLGEAFPVAIPHLSDDADGGDPPTQFQTISSLWVLVLVVGWDPGPTASVIATATAIADLARKVAPWRMGLNVSTSTICAATAWLAYATVDQGAGPPSLRWILAVLVAGVVHSLVNHVLFKVGFGLFTGRGLRAVGEDLGVAVSDAVQRPFLAMVVSVITRISPLLTITTAIPAAAIMLAIREQYRRRLAAEEAARNAAKLAQQEAALARRQQELLTQLSHAVRTPLTVVLGVCDTLRRRYADLPIEAQQDMVQQALRAARHLTGLVDNVLRAAGYDVEASGVTRARQEVDLTALACEIVEQERVHLPDVRVELWSGGPLRVIGDPDGLTMVLRNLLDNAAHATPPGGRILVTATRAEPVAMAVVAVEDEGPGVAAAERRRVFDPFVRLGSYGSGIGLGLHVADAEAHLHGGTVVHTDPAVLAGARVELRLPLAGEAAPPEAVLESPWPVAVARSNGREDLRPPKQLG